MSVYLRHAQPQLSGFRFHEKLLLHVKSSATMQLCEGLLNYSANLPPVGQRQIETAAEASGMQDANEHRVDSGRGIA